MQFRSLINFIIDCQDYKITVNNAHINDIQDKSSMRKHNIDTPPTNYEDALYAYFILVEELILHDI